MADNVLTLLYKGKTHCVADAIWQWDYGRVLYFGDLTLDDPFEIHLANIKVKGFASVHIGTNNRIEIPKAYLMTGLPIYGWIYVHPTESSGQTEYTFCVPIKGRAEPNPGEVIPEDEIPVFEELMALLRNAERNAAQYAEAAELSAQAAARSEESAAQEALEAVRSISFDVNETDGTLEVTLP